MTDTLDTLQEFIAAIERIGELKRISQPVSVHLEMCEIADRVMKLPGGGPALLFEKPVLRDGSISSYPVHTPRGPLEDWLQYPTTPLSEKATRGFLTRTDSASLRFPPRFLDAVRQHLRAIEGSGAAARAV